MSLTLKKIFWNVRRFILMNFIPEFIWPRKVVIDGVPLQIRNTPYSFGTKWLLSRTDEYEQLERRLITEILSPGQVVFEMGGSIGILTAIMAKQTSPGGKVISVEASGNLTSFSRTWLERTGNIQVLTGFAFPVYECNKNIRINSFDEASGSLGGVVSFETGDEKEASLKPGNNIYDIKTIINQTGLMPDILVIDIEGSERMFLEDDNKLPDSIRFILIELHPQMYGEPVKQEIIFKIQQKGFATKKNYSNVYLFEKSK